MIEYCNAILEVEKKQTEEFLKNFELSYDNDIDFTLNAYVFEEVVATVSVAKNIIKALAISDAYQGQSLANTLISKAVNYIYEQGYDNVFVFTKPSNSSIFKMMFFKEIISTSHISLLEYGSSINSFLESIKQQYNLYDSEYAAIVVNCNPMTKGHLYLIEQCALENEHVLVFVVEEDLSYFAFEDRFYIVEKECAKFSNVTVVPSTKYLISTQTFPTYFIKDHIDRDEKSIELDLKIFAKYFMKIFNIKIRYVGSEPYSPLTNQYNQAMKKYLSNVKEIVRKKDGEEFISATKVRELIAQKDLNALKRIVPPTSFKVICDKYLK